MTKFDQRGIRPFGVNPADVAAHREYVSLFGFQFPLLSDPDRAMARAFHALADDARGIVRSVYVIGRDGTIRFARRGYPAVDDIVGAVAP
jgi:peroxiredoxin Q/BCP